MENGAGASNNQTEDTIGGSGTATTQVDFMREHNLTTSRGHREEKRPSERRRAALRRLRRMRIKSAMRASGVASANTALARLASETIQRLEQRIRYLAQAGDREHVRRLRAVQQQLIATYEKPAD